MCSNNCVDVVELDYVVLKLNGSDITSLSSYEAVQMFLQAKENLVVELCRKKKNPISENPLLSGEVPPSFEAENCSPIASASSNPNQIILTLRASNNIENKDVVSKETQTIENFADLKKSHNKDIVQTIADHFIEREHHLFEQCLEPEIDIEEVTLVKRDSGQDQIGLSVCSNGFFNNKDSNESIICANNTDVISDDEDVFISDIQAEGIADTDGRLRRGDQILRINGMDIKSKKHAEAQIAENSMAVTLLVSRLLYPEDDDDDDDDDEDDDEDIDSNFEYANSFLPDDYTNVVDKLDKVLLTQRQSMKPVIELITGPAAKPIKIQANTAEVLKGKAHTNSISSSAKPRISCHMKSEQESNSSQEIPLKPSIAKSQPNTTIATIATTATTTATKIGCNSKAKSKQYDYDESEHIYETIPEDSESEPLYCSPYQSSNYMTAMGSCSSPMMPETADILEMQQQTQRVAQWLGIKSQISPRSVHTLAGRPSLNNKQQHRISNRVYTLRSAITNTSGSSSSGGAAYSNNLDNENQCINLHEEVDNSSSAYNTGGSNNSASPRQNATNLDNELVTANANNPLIAGSYQPNLAKDTTFLTSPISSMLMLPFGNGKNARILCSQPANPSEITTINKAAPDDLHPFASSAKIDPKLMRPKPTAEEQQGQCPQFNAPNLSRYHFVSSQEVASKTVTVPKPSSILVTTESVSEEIPMVWKVKRRPDGTRYIVKRPVRNNVNVGIRKSIRNNEITTTEDDTISEVKIGRYWTREERKRHIERARERRHHQQLLHQQQQQQQQQQQLHPTQ